MPELKDDTDDDAIPEYAPLTHKQRAFLDYVIESDWSYGSLIESYKSAYAWTGSDKAASVEASRLIRNPKITLAMRERTQANGVDENLVIAGVRRVAESRDDQASLNAYLALGRYLGLWDGPTTAPPTLQQNNVVALGTGALADVLGMLNGTPSSESGDDATKAIDAVSADDAVHKD
jgi:hypothetical protein